MADAVESFGTWPPALLEVRFSCLRASSLEIWGDIDVGWRGGDVGIGSVDARWGGEMMMDLDFGVWGVVLIVF